MIGGSAMIDDAILALKNKGLVLKIMEGFRQQKACLVGTAPLDLNLKSKFGELINRVWSHKTHSTPKFLMVRPMEYIKKISMEDQQTY